MADFHSTGEISDKKSTIVETNNNVETNNTLVPTAFATSVIVLPDNAATAIEHNETLGTYKISIKNRSYSEYSIHDSSSLVEKRNVNVDPVKFKMFNGDVFEINLIDPYYHIIYSAIRNVSYISGILICQDKTYGRIKNKFYYKCIPDDRRLPHFLVAYEIKSNSFSKHFKNKYVNFKFKSWETKHPIGELTQVIGDVDKLDNFYEYQLYCKSINASIQHFTKNTLNILKSKTFEDYTDMIIEKYNVEKRIDNYNIFTIDSNNTTDFDDAFSIVKNSNNTTSISIYISNVALWLDVLNLWTSFSERVATIYMPDRKRPMLPTILSECLCSLREGQNRFAIALDLLIDNDGNILKHSFKNVLINIKKNYNYDDKELVQNPEYQMLFNEIEKMNKQKSYNLIVKSSSDVIAYLMIMMNYHSAIALQKYKTGIFRCNTINNNVESKYDNLNNEIKQFIKIWNSNAGQYISFKEFQMDNTIFKGHQILELESYVHITSPIRRIVDLLNIIMLQINVIGIEFDEKCNYFLNKWDNQLEHINICMRAIRKVQVQSTLLDLCTNNPNIENTVYDGYVFDKFERNDKLYQYIVYIPKLKMVSRITSRIKKDNYDKCCFRIYTFDDEDQFKKKVRLDLL